jgi:uncharacterized repeat protein (TIGR03806 family)
MRWLLVVLVLVGGCDRPRGEKFFATCTPPTADVIAPLDANSAGARFGQLSDLCLVDTDEMGWLVFSSKSVDYELTTPLFSDYAIKNRTIYLQPGAQATYADVDPFDLPVGTIITKSFSFSDDESNPALNGRVHETRILMRATSGWLALPYKWDDARREAPLFTGGTVEAIHFTAPNGTNLDANYLVPSSAQCAACHVSDDVQHPIGPKARLLNRDHTYPDGTVENQLDHWTRLGLLAGAPPSASAPRLPVFDDPSTGTVAERARAWLETNCAHCHSSGGLARTTGLFLGTDQTNPYAWGVCKTPIAAGPASGGFFYDIFPGQPDQSILVYRIESTAPGTMMPEVGRSVVHAEGVQVVRDFISQLVLPPCQ